MDKIGKRRFLGVIIQHFDQYLSNRMSKNKKLGVKKNRELPLNPLKCFVLPYLQYFRREILKTEFHESVRILRTSVSAVGHTQIGSMSLPTRLPNCVIKPILRSYYLFPSVWTKN